MKKQSKKLLNALLIVSMTFSYFGGMLPAKEVQAQEAETSREEMEMNEEIDPATQKLLDGEKLRLSSFEIYAMSATPGISQDIVSVLFKDEQSLDIRGVAQSLGSDTSELHATDAPKVGNSRFAPLLVPEDMTVMEFLSELNSREDVLIAEPSYPRELHAWTPNDPEFAPVSEPGQWQLQNSTTSGGYSIDMPDAWGYMNDTYGPEMIGGSNDVTVAVIDSGLAYETRDVTESPSYENGWSFTPSTEAPSLWTNTGETETDGQDNDGNGIIDDYHGVNFHDYWWYWAMYGTVSEEEGHPNDDLEHGTHVAQIIAGQTNNGSEGEGAGIAFNVKVMPIKIFDYAGRALDISAFGSTLVADSVAYANIHGADVINMSLGGSDYSAVENATFADVAKDGVISVASSGNDGNTEKKYPAAYSSVIAVGATNLDGSRSYYSTYGSWIDLVAPVGSIYEATGYQGMYQYNYTCAETDTCISGGPWDPTSSSFTTFSWWKMQGTSFAAPQVSAVAALLKSIDGGLGINQIRTILNESAVDVGASGFDSETGYGVLNANNAVQMKDENGNNIMVWDNWTPHGVQTPGNIELKEFNGRLYQAIRGHSTTIWIRSTADGTNWDSWVNMGVQTPGDIELEVFNGKLYMAIRGHSTTVWTRATADGTNWDNWVNMGVQTPGNIELEVFDNNLYLAIRGHSTTAWVRSTTDGTNWNSWTNLGVQTPGDITLKAFNGKLNLALRGHSTTIWTRSTSDGTDWNSWINMGVQTPGNIELEVFNSKLYMAIRGHSTTVWTRATADGTNWDSWVNMGVQTPGVISLKNFDGKLYLAVRGHSTTVWSRSSLDGTTWLNWVNMTVQTPGNIALESFNGELYFGLRGHSTEIWTTKTIYH